MQNMSPGCEKKPCHASSIASPGGEKAGALFVNSNKNTFPV